MNLPMTDDAMNAEAYDSRRACKKVVERDAYTDGRTSTVNQSVSAPAKRIQSRMKFHASLRQMCKSAESTLARRLVNTILSMDGSSPGLCVEGELIDEWIQMFSMLVETLSDILIQRCRAPVFTDEQHYPTGLKSAMSKAVRGWALQKIYCLQVEPGTASSKSSLRLWDEVPVPALFETTSRCAPLANPAFYRKRIYYAVEDDIAMTRRLSDAEHDPEEMHEYNYTRISHTKKNISNKSRWKNSIEMTEGARYVNSSQVLKPGCTPIPVLLECMPTLDTCKQGLYWMLTPWVHSVQLLVLGLARPPEATLFMLLHEPQQIITGLCDMLFQDVLKDIIEDSEIGLCRLHGYLYHVARCVSRLSLTIGDADCYFSATVVHHTLIGHARHCERRMIKALAEADINVDNMCIQAIQCYNLMTYRHSKGCGKQFQPLDTPTCHLRRSRQFKALMHPVPRLSHGLW